MLKEINKEEFVQEFDKAGRGDNFTRQAREALYDYIEENLYYYKLDTIALCCDFTEYESIEDYNINHETTYTCFEELSDIGNINVIIFNEGKSGIVQQ